MSGGERPIWGVNYNDSIYLTHLGDPETGAEYLELTIDRADVEETIVLDMDGVKKLRLALQRFERTARR